MPSVQPASSFQDGISALIAALNEPSDPDRFFIETTRENHPIVENLTGYIIPYVPQKLNEPIPEKTNELSVGEVNPSSSYFSECYTWLKSCFGLNPADGAKKSSSDALYEEYVRQESADYLQKTIELERNRSEQLQDEEEQIFKAPTDERRHFIALIKALLNFHLENQKGIINDAEQLRRTLALNKVIIENMDEALKEQIKNGDRQLFFQFCELAQVSSSSLPPLQGWGC